MKKVYFILVFVVMMSKTIFSQCSGNSYYFTYTLADNTCPITNYTMDNTIWAGDYIIISNLQVGSTVYITTTLSRCITIRTGSSSGTLVASGTGSVSFTAPATTVYVLYNANCSTCGTNTTNGTSVFNYEPPTNTHDCYGATQLCSNTSQSANSGGKCTSELGNSGSVYVQHNSTTCNAANASANYAADLAACESVYGAGNCDYMGYYCVAANRIRNYFAVNVTAPDNNGCLLSGENQSSWYYINFTGGTGGTFTFQISPTTSTDDYDFAIWGPFTSSNVAANCPPTTSPLRCNYSSTTGSTGLSTSVSNNYVYSGMTSPTGNQSASMNVSAGDIYILLVDNYSNSGNSYNLTFGGTSSLGCSSVPLPVELINFTVTYQSRKNILKWETATEINNKFFEIERSTDGANWKFVGRVNGSGTASISHSYELDDSEYELTTNYYRLSQIDFDGSKVTKNIISIDNSLKSKTLVKLVNSLGQEVDESYKGLVIYIYSDGTIIKKFNQ